MAVKTLDHYLSLNYPYELIRDTEEGGFFVTHPDLDGCAAQGETAEEAVENLDVARELWIETRLEDGLPVPEPAPEEPSGRVSLRMPSSLHAKLVRVAERQGVSLNLLLNAALAEYVGGAATQITMQDLVRELTSIVARARGPEAAAEEPYDSAPRTFSVNEPGSR